MPEFKTVADYVKLPDVSETIKNQLQVQNLRQQIEQAPLEYKIKEIDAALKGNQLLMTDIANEKARADLVSARNQEARTQIQFLNDQMLNLRQGYQQSFEFGEMMRKRVFPGAIAHKNEDGSVSLAFPGQAPFKMYPSQITDPKELDAAQKDRADRWAKLTGRYQTVYTQYSTASELLGVGNGESDRAAIYAIARMQDPLGSVRQGDYDSVISSPNVSQQVKNWLIRATTTEGPVFGGPDSPTRTNMKDLVGTIWRNEKMVVEPQVRTFVQGAILGDGLDPKKSIYDVGDLTIKALTAPASENEGNNTGTVPVGGSEATRKPGATATRSTPNQTPRAPELKLSTPEERAASFEALMTNLFVTPQPER